MADVVRVSPEEMLALMNGASRIRTIMLDDGRLVKDEGQWSQVVRAVLGDEWVIPFAMINVEVDWTDHGSHPIRYYGELMPSAIDHPKGICKRCGGINYV